MYYGAALTLRADILNLYLEMYLDFLTLSLVPEYTVSNPGGEAGNISFSSTSCDRYVQSPKYDSNSNATYRGTDPLFDDPLFDPLFKNKPCHLGQTLYLHTCLLWQLKGDICHI